MFCGKKGSILQKYIGLVEKIQNTDNITDNIGSVVDNELRIKLAGFDGICVGVSKSG